MQDLSIILLILDHQNEPAHAGLVSCSTVTGSVKEKVDPCPGLDWTQMRPPCSSTMRLEIVSPSPVPPFSRVIAEFGLLKFLENLGLIRFGNAGARVADRNRDRAVGGRRP